MQFTVILRKHVGTIIAAIGFVLLCIITFGDIGQVFGEQYWENVKNNITAISFLSIGLTLIQVSIRQGLAEQALQRGLNTEKTTQKYIEHKEIVAANTERMIYLPYFLQIYNKRHTKLRKQEFLINNNFSSEASLYASKDTKTIRAYNNIRTKITAENLKWSTVEVVKDKYERIVSLEEHRYKRIGGSIIASLGGMIGVTFLTNGLFFTPSSEPLWQKFVKLLTYILSIALSSIFATVKEYEKGAFSVPNELDEINEIWHEFSVWEIPQWILDEVKALNESEVINEKDKARNDSRVDIQKEPEKVESVSYNGTDNSLAVSDIDSVLCQNDSCQ